MGKHGPLIAIAVIILMVPLMLFVTKKDKEKAVPQVDPQLIDLRDDVSVLAHQVHNLSARLQSRVEEVKPKAKKRIKKRSARSARAEATLR